MIPFTELPVMSTALFTKLPVMSTALYTKLPVMSTALFTELPVMSTALFTKLPVMSTALFTKLPVMSTALFTKLPVMSIGLFTELPVMSTALFKNTAVPVPVTQNEMYYGTVTRNFYKVFNKVPTRYLLPGIILMFTMFPMQLLSEFHIDSFTLERCRHPDETSENTSMLRRRRLNC